MKEGLTAACASFIGSAAELRPDAAAGAPRTINGSCLCGRVVYTITGELGRAFYCHCSRCRKTSGSAMAANATIRSDQFEVVAGADHLRRYDASSGLQRVFCGACGSPIYSWRPAEPAVMRIRMGTLDSADVTAPSAHVFFDSRAPWHTVADELPRHGARLPPGGDC